VIANAGISNDASPIETATVDSVQEHINVNAIGPYLLFQATFGLLKKAKQPKFVVIGSALGSIGYMEQRAAHGLFAYGASKAMAHWTSRRIHFSHENIISFVVDPVSYSPYFYLAISIKEQGEWFADYRSLC